MYLRSWPVTVEMYVPLLSVGALPYPAERLVGRFVVVVVVVLVVEAVVAAVVKMVLGMQFPARHRKYY